MAKTCIKCGYVRRDTDTGPDYACPACGVVYAKAEAAQARAVVAQARAAPLATPQPKQAPTAGASAAERADALIRQFALAQAAEPRKASPYRGVALVALVAFSVGFASAAGLYSAAEKLQKQALAQRCK